MSLACELMMDEVLHFQGSCWPFCYSLCMGRFLKVANVSLAFELMIDSCFFKALVDLFDEKVANVSLAFELMMDGVLHFQGSCWPFYYSQRMHMFFTRRWPM